MLLLFFICVVAIAYLTPSLYAQRTELKILKIKYRPADELFAVVEHLQSKDGNVSVDPNTNSLIISDYPRNIEQMTRIVNELDVLPKQVEINVMVAEVTDRLLRDIGISTGQLIIPSGEFEAIAHLINTSEEETVRSQMTVRTMSHRSARVQVRVDEFFGHTVTHIGSDKTIVTPETRSAGDMLEVLPRVMNDESIMVMLMPSRSAFRDDESMYESSILTEVVVNNGDTIALGGVDAVRTQTGKTSDALLDYSLSTARTDEHKKVVMFLTVTIVKE
jgi:type II secretory pathway component GspD/PulD (secretin)